MKKLVNVRLSLVCALALISGIFSFYKFLFANVWYLVGSLALIAAVAVALAIAKSKKWVFCLVALAFFAVGFGACFAEYQIRGESQVVVQNGVLSGRVTDIGRNGEPSRRVYLENCQFEGEKIDGRVQIYLYDAEEVSTGDVISVYGTLRQCYAFTSQIDTTDSVKHRVTYILSDAQNLIRESGELTVGEKVRRYIYETTFNTMPQNSDIAYALLTGDRNALDEAKKDAFIEAGIIHLLVVSGLHVGFIISIFGFVLKKLKLPVWCELLILLVPIGFYAYICDFSPSVVRAVVMTICLYISKILRGKYDLLTSLCWAVLVILISQPLYLFDVGFQLSAMSVFGIATLYLRLNRLAARRKMPKIVAWLFGTVSMSFSCVVSTVFVSAYTFKTAVWLGIIVNILAIPLVFVAFTLCVFGMVPWIFRYLLLLADWVLEFVLKVAELAQKADAVLPLKTSAWAILVCGILLFILGGYVNFPKKIKWLSCGMFGVLLIICVLSASVPKNCDNRVSVFVGYDDAVIVATSRDNSAVVVGNFGDYATDLATEYLEDRNVDQLVLCVTSAKDSDSLYFDELNKKFKITKVYYLDSSGNTVTEDFLTEKGIPLVRAQYNSVIAVGHSVATASDVGEIGTGNSACGKTYGEDVITVQSVYDGGLSGVVVKIGNISVATVLGGEVKTKHFADLRSDVNIYAVTLSQKYYSELGLLTLSRYCEGFSGNFGANKFGNFTFTEKHGKIEMNFGI